MTNFEKWQFYTKNLESPQSFIDFGFYWLISACLQRRVWYYADEGALFVNLYGCFVGPPSVGKGLVIGRAKELLLYHRNERKPKIQANTGQEYPPLFPVGGDTITFEALLANMADNPVITPVSKEIFKTGVYLHTSYAFCLTELSSLFKKHKDDVIKFLIKAFDCEDYDNITKTAGQDRIRKMCLNFLAGTQFDFIRESYRTQLFGQGFASRVVWLFEHQPRFDKFHVSEKDVDMDAARWDLLQWIKRLYTVIGQLTYDQEVREWLEHWYITELVPKRNRATAKMQEYLGRKRVHLLKLAAAVHFSEKLDRIITLNDVQTAKTFLDTLEPNMAAGFALSGRNELHHFTIRMLHLIKHKATPKKFIILEFGMDITLDEIDTCLKELEMAYSVRVRIEQGEAVYYI